jgi:predicted pyridoxine 5'-phosphate oxidase superfamily flavin-nucleotide-binding protein
VSSGGASFTLADIERCFGGAIPAVLATVSPDGVANVTYISRAHQVDSERVALSNQFMSKTARNLAGNPRASLLLMDPATHDEYRLTLVYERTDRRGHVFERLRADIDALGVLGGMQDVFRLRAADVFRVVEIAAVPRNPSGKLPDELPAQRADSPELRALAELAGVIGRAGDLDLLVETALEALDRLLGYRHTNLLLLDEDGRRLYTIASRGFDSQGIGAEVEVGTGHIGMAAARCETLRIGSLQQVAKYSRSIRRSYQESGIGPGREVAVPAVDHAGSRIVVPLQALGQLIGVLVAESRRTAAFNAADEHVLGVGATLLASAIEAVRALDVAAEPAAGAAVTVAAGLPAMTAGAGVGVRYFASDASVFFDGEYMIKGVAGRILWSLLVQHGADGRTDFTNRELRLDPTLDMPGFKDNLESRLILLKRRLDERDAPMRIHKTGRGRFRLEVTEPLRLECADA